MIDETAIRDIRKSLSNMMDMIEYLPPEQKRISYIILQSDIELLDFILEEAEEHVRESFEDILREYRERSEVMMWS